MNIIQNKLNEIFETKITFYKFDLLNNKITMNLEKIENGIRSNHKLELEKISTAYFINNTSNTNTVLGPDFLGTATVAPSSLPGTQNRGTLTTQVYLTAGQVFSIRFYQSSTAVQPISSTNGTTNFTVVKLL